MLKKLIIISLVLFSILFSAPMKFAGNNNAGTYFDITVTQASTTSITFYNMHNVKITWVVVEKFPMSEITHSNDFIMLQTVKMLLNELRGGHNAVMHVKNTPSYFIFYQGYCYILSSR